MGSKHVHVKDIVKNEIKFKFNKGAFYWSTLYDYIVMHSTTTNITICTPCNNKLSQLKSPNTLLVSTLTSPISIDPRCPDSDGIIFP
jgi:hypothetical protein